MDPMYDMYSGMVESCSRAARQMWGSKGLWIPETVGFDGLQELPEDIAAEMRDLYLLRKPWALRSYRFRKFADRKQPHCSPWNWKGSGRWIDGEYVYKSLHGDPFGYLVHIPTTTAKVAYLFWLRYEYTMDRAWLRDRAYPMLKGTAEFFRNYPNVRKGNDGKYHVHNTNTHEPIRGCQDPMESLAAMYGILPLAIRAAEILGVDADLRPAWQELLDNLAPLPTNDDVNSITPRKPGQTRFWTAGRKPLEGGRTDCRRNGCEREIGIVNQLGSATVLAGRIQARRASVCATVLATHSLALRACLDNSSGAVHPATPQAVTRPDWLRCNRSQTGRRRNHEIHETHKTGGTMELGYLARIRRE
jgi:hypothetical protein